MQLGKKTTILSTITLSLILSSCGGVMSNNINRSLDSVHQPVVSHNHFVMDVQTSGGSLAASEQQRLSDWLRAMNVGYGDRVAIDDPSPYGNRDAYNAVSALVARHGMVMADAAPITASAVQPGFIRVVISRSQAYVPGCPDWSTKSDTDFSSRTSSNFGCAANSNLAAMVADPNDLVKGSNGALSDPVSAAKAIKAYRDAVPTGTGGLSRTSTKGGN